MAAGDAVVKGTNAFTEQPETRRWIRGKGWRKIRSWLGPFNDTKIAEMVETLQGLATEEIDIREGHPTLIQAALPLEGDGVVDVRSNIDALTEWTLEPYDLQKTLGSHGIFNGSDSSAEAMAVIDKELRAGEAYGKDYTTQYGGIGSLTEYARLKGQGVDTWLTFGYVVRSVLTCERDNVYVEEFQSQADNVGKVITWEEIGIPSIAKIKQPRVWLYQRLGVGWEWVTFNEWLVRPAAIRFVKEGRVRKRQLVQEFIGAAQWSETLYDGGTGKP